MYIKRSETESFDQVVGVPVTGISMLISRFWTSRWIDLAWVQQFMCDAVSAYQQIPKKYHDCNLSDRRNIDGGLIFDIAFEILYCRA